MGLLQSLHWQQGKYNPHEDQRAGRHFNHFGAFRSTCVCVNARRILYRLQQRKNFHQEIAMCHSIKAAADKDKMIELFAWYYSQEQASDNIPHEQYKWAL